VWSDFTSGRARGWRACNGCRLPAILQRDIADYTLKSCKFTTFLSYQTPRCRWLRHAATLFRSCFLVASLTLDVILVANVMYCITSHCIAFSGNARSQWSMLAFLIEMKQAEIEAMTDVSAL
jgi:hypothetical protein